MMAEPDSIVLEHLWAIRGEMGKMADYMQTLSVVMTAIRQHLAGVITLQDHDHGDIAAIKHRLDRIERRLELAE